MKRLKHLDIILLIFGVVIVGSIIKLVGEAQNRSRLEAAHLDYLDLKIALEENDLASAIEIFDRGMKQHLHTPYFDSMMIIIEPFGESGMDTEPVSEPPPLPSFTNGPDGDGHEGQTSNEDQKQKPSK